MRTHEEIENIDWRARDPDWDEPCIECGGDGDQDKLFLRMHGSGLCKTCYDEFKQRLRDDEVQGVE